MSAILAIIGPAINLVILIFTEVYSEIKRARLANEKYQMTREKFNEIAQKCLDRMRTEAAREAQEAKNVEDQIDVEKKKP